MWTETHTSTGLLSGGYMFLNTINIDFNTFFEKTVICTQKIEGCTLGVCEASQNKTMKVIFVDYILLSSFL